MEGRKRKKKEGNEINLCWLPIPSGSPSHCFACLHSRTRGVVHASVSFLCSVFGFGATLASTAVLDMLLSSWLVTSESSATLLIPLGFQFTTLSLFFYLRSYCFSKNCWFFSVSIAFSHWNASCLSPYTLPFVYLHSFGYLVSWL